MWCKSDIPNAVHEYTLIHLILSTWSYRGLGVGNIPVVDFQSVFNAYFPSYLKFKHLRKAVVLRYFMCWKTQVLRNRYQGMVCQATRLLAAHKGIKRPRLGNFEDIEVLCSLASCLDFQIFWCGVPGVCIRSRLVLKIPVPQPLLSQNGLIGQYSDRNRLMLWQKLSEM